MSNVGVRRVVGYLLFKELDIENANALSGHLVYGTPAITGIKGAFHSMSRKVLQSPKTSDMRVALRGVLVACHKYGITASRSQEYKDYRFHQQRVGVTTKNDLAKMAKNISPSIIEQAYCNVKMSFIVEVVSDHDLSQDEQMLLEQEACKIVQHSRIAGGTVRLFKDKSKVKYFEYSDLDSISYQISGSYVLSEASVELEALVDKYSDKSALDILINICTTKWTKTENDDGGVKWQASKLSGENGFGWLVPITVGFQSISTSFSADSIENSRVDDESKTNSSYVEAVYGLGKWESPHKLRIENKLLDAFWYYNYQESQSLYTITTKPKN